MTEPELKTELAYYEKHVQDWMKEHEGKYVLLRGEEVAGFFDTPQAAYEAGVSRYGTDPFFIRRVTQDEPNDSVPALACGVIRAVT